MGIFLCCKAYALDKVSLETNKSNNKEAGWAKAQPTNYFIGDITMPLKISR
ncbi:MAG: hypothetical protein QM652_07500 [Legionella sp.]|uniref:hypothetical protein n=1 Tax=Legionella sp. TaxID=459 RepID=UPI0039E5A05A